MASLAKSMPSLKAVRQPQSKSVASRKTPKMTSLADAKANLSSIINAVERSRAEIIVMRRGTPVAKIVPFEPSLPSAYGWMRGTVRELGDIVGPTGEEWTVGDE
jgi:prevent-host-death family protein